MGYTHHDKISVVTALAVGSSTAGETDIIDGSGNITVAGTLTGSAGVSYDTSQGVMNFWGTDGTTHWACAPYACDVSGYVILSVSSGTGRTVSVIHGSAGDNAMMWSGGVTGTIGKVIAMTASAVPSLTALEPFRVVISTAGTAQLTGVTLILTKT